MFCVNNWCARIQQRWVHTIMSALGWALGYSMSICLSITITEMVKPVNITEVLNADSCPADINEPTKNISLDSADLFDWDHNTQSIILSSFFWGCLIGQFFGNILANKIGAKYTIGFGILVAAFITVITPETIRWGDYQALIVLRVLLGISTASILPAQMIILSEWTPKNEKSLHASIVINGSGIGSVIAMFLAGPILRYYHWSVVLYLFAVAGMLWFILWMLICYDNPRVHPFVSGEEAKYLHEDLKNDKHVQAQPFPWRDVFRSPPFWALLIIQCGYGWCTILVDTDVPLYTRNVLKLQIDSTGYLNSLPHLTSVLFSIVSAWLADWMIVKQNISATFVRKLFAFVAIIIPAFFFLGTSYAGCNQPLAVGLLIIAITLTGSIFPSMKVNALDLSPNYAGTISSLTLATGMIFYILSPYVTGLLTPNHSVSEWRLVFWILFVILIVTGSVFLMCASGDVQRWNNPQFRDKESVHEEFSNHRLPNNIYNGTNGFQNQNYRII